MIRHIAAPLCALLLAACSKDSASSSGQAPRGLPKAGEGGAPAAQPGQAAAGPAPAMNDPHAGIDMNDPHAGMNMDDPHAGMNMDDPHAGGTPPPPVDPGQFLKGQIVASAATAPSIKPGAILFLSVKPVEPLSGEIIGSTLAVERIDVDALPVAFHLTGANAMMPTTKFAGDVVISARIDQDGEARSKQPGDVEGSLRARIPADGLTLTLDTVVK